MATYFVNDDGSNTSPYDTWEKAATSVAALSTALAGNFAGHTVYVGDDHSEPGTGAAKTLNATGRAIMISSDVLTGSSVSYLKGTGNQYYTGDGAYDITIDGPWEIYGIRFVTGRDFLSSVGALEQQYYFEPTIVPASGRSAWASAVAGRVVFDKPTINLSADSGSQSGGVITGSGIPLIMRDMVFVSETNRTGAIFDPQTNGGQIFASGDFSGFTNFTECELVSGTDLGAEVVITNSKTKSGVVYATTAVPRAGRISIVNTGSDDQPRQRYWKDRYGVIQSQSSVYRNGGATVEGDAVSWKLDTSANATEGIPLYTEWLYGKVATTGSKTFTVAVAHNNAGTGTGSALTDAEAWLEVEFMGTADSPLYSLGSDHRTITTAPADQTTDGASSWTGSPGGDLQLLEVAATVNEPGVYRARVALARASVTVYVDPKVTVT